MDGRHTDFFAGAFVVVPEGPDHRNLAAFLPELVSPFLRLVTRTKSKDGEPFDTVDLPANRLIPNFVRHEIEQGGGFARSLDRISRTGDRRTPESDGRNVPSLARYSRPDFGQRLVRERLRKMAFDRATDDLVNRQRHRSFHLLHKAQRLGRLALLVLLTLRP